jgi:hypothetical protein
MFHSTTSIPHQNAVNSSYNTPTPAVTEHDFASNGMIDLHGDNGEPLSLSPTRDPWGSCDHLQLPLLNEEEYGAERATPTLRPRYSERFHYPEQVRLVSALEEQDILLPYIHASFNKAIEIMRPKAVRLEIGKPHKEVE